MDVWYLQNIMQKRGQENSVSIDTKIIGKKIRELRKKKKLTQEDLGEASGLDYTSIGAAERGERNLSVRSLLRVAEALEADAGYFIPASKKLNTKTEKGEKIKKIIDTLEILNEEQVELVEDFVGVLEKRKKK